MPPNSTPKPLQASFTLKHSQGQDDAASPRQVPILSKLTIKGTYVLWAIFSCQCLFPLHAGQSPMTPISKITASDADQSQDPAPPLLPVPIAVIETLEFDWGTLVQGEKTQFAFLIENKGRVPLKILKVTATCGCTTTRFDAEVAPGEVGAVELEIDTAEFPGGRPRRNAVVKTNDPLNSEINLWLVGNIDPILLIEPSVTKISGLVTEKKEKTIFLKKAVDAPVEILDVGSKNGSFKVESLTPTEGGWNLKISAEPSDGPKSIRDDLQVRVRVDQDHPLDFPLPIVVEHQDIYRFIPGGNVVYYRRHTAPLDGPVKRRVIQEVHVQSARSDIAITEFKARIEDAPEGLFGLQIIEELPGQHYRLEIEVLKSHPTPQAMGTLVMDLGGGEIRKKSVIAQFRLKQIPKQDSKEQ